MAIRYIMTVTVKDPTVTPTKYYRVKLTLRDANRYNNGCLVSIGLEVVKGGTFSPASLKRLMEAGRVEEITQETWNHSGCQSSCKMRGGKECRW